jgi:hypothetical protein
MSDCSKQYQSEVMLVFIMLWLIDIALNVEEKQLRETMQGEKCQILTQTGRLGHFIHHTM